MAVCGRRRCTLLYVKRLSLQAARGHQHTHTPPRARAPRPSNARERAHPPPKAAALWKTRGQRRMKAPCTYKRGCGDPQHGSAARSGPPPPAELRRGAARHGAARRDCCCRQCPGKRRNVPSCQWHGAKRKRPKRRAADGHNGVFMRCATKSTVTDDCCKSLERQSELACPKKTSETKKRS